MRRFLERSQLRFLTTVVVVSTTNGPCTLRVCFRDLRFFKVTCEEDFSLDDEVTYYLYIFSDLSSCALVVTVSYLRNFTGTRIMLSLLIRHSIASRRNDLYRTMGVRFLVRQRYVRSLRLMARRLSINGTLINICVAVYRILGLCL